MSPILFILGLIITLITIYDMVYTILAPRGSAFIAARVSRTLWRFSLKFASDDGRSTKLRFVGPILLLIIVLTWIVLLWLGNTLIVFSDPEALWSSSDNAYVTSFVDNLYFTAYVLSSMGSGDFTPASDWWMFYTGFISYTGVVFISLGISFLIPVIEAITLKRQVSIMIHNMGKSPEEILNNYKHDNFKQLTNLLGNLEPKLIKIAQYHLAYPVIHYFHSSNLYEALPVQLVSLDETMSIMLYKVNDEDIDDRRTLERSYRAMTYYLSTLTYAFIEPEDDEPKRPDTEYLNDVSKSDSALNEKDNSNLILRRKILLAYLQNDGWTWDILYEGKDEIKLKQLNSATN